MNDKVPSSIKIEFSRHSWRLVAIIAVVITVQAALLYFILFTFRSANTNSVTIIVLTLASVSLIVVGFMTYLMVDALEARVEQQAFSEVEDKIHELQIAIKVGQALQKMASTLRATRSFEQVMDQALDVCSLLFEESGIPGRSLVGAVFLYEADQLKPIATRRLMPGDEDQKLEGIRGVVAEALNNAEVAITTLAGCGSAPSNMAC
jgi:hypothetical protein